jgi:hypothetical protein
MMKNDNNGKRMYIMEDEVVGINIGLRVDEKKREYLAEIR